MHFSRLTQLSVIPVFLTYGLCAAPTQDQSRILQQGGNGNQNEPLKAISKPMEPYPKEAEKKRVEGKVTLSIVVDAGGNVSEARALSGPPELVPTAIASAKMRKFEPPAHPPVTKTTWISYGFPKECPGPISDFGSVSSQGGLRNDKGLVLVPVDIASWRVPRYPDEDRKAGVAGDGSVPHGQSQR